MPDQNVFRRRHLPHWDVAGAAFFVTTCLSGSVSARGLLDIGQYRVRIAGRARPPGKTEAEWAVHRWKLEFTRLDRWLDQDPTARHLENPLLASRVVGAAYHFANDRNDLLAYVVMPSHFHWLFRPRESWVTGCGSSGGRRTPRERIMHGFKLHTARKCNEILGRDGPFWQAESYDHWVHDLDELVRIVAYTEGNPVEAGLARTPEDWPYSSAADRKALGLSPGTPLPNRNGEVRIE